MRRLGRILVSGVIVFAASSAAQAPAFDAATIKPAPPGKRGYGITPQRARLVAQNVTLKDLIAEAYHVYAYQIEGGPKWIATERFDLEGKSAAPADHQKLRDMLRTLLADRFALDIRHESKEMAILSLEVAKGGPKLAAPKDPEAEASFRVFQRRQITAHNAPLDYLAEALTALVGKPVLDHTGLAGKYDYQLEWTPDEYQISSTEAPPQIEGAMPPLTLAIQQQMGLRLLPKRAPVDIIVINKVEPLAAN